MMAWLRSEVQVSWQALLDGVLRHALETPAGELAEYDAERLERAAAVIRERIVEEARKREEADSR